MSGPQTSKKKNVFEIFLYAGLVDGDGSGRDWPCAKLHRGW